MSETTVDRRAQELLDTHPKGQISAAYRATALELSAALAQAQDREQASVAVALEQAANVRMIVEGSSFTLASQPYGRQWQEAIRALITPEAASALSRREAAVRLEEHGMACEMCIENPEICKRRDLLEADLRAKSGEQKA